MSGFRQRVRNGPDVGNVYKLRYHHLTVSTIARTVKIIVMTTGTLQARFQSPSRYSTTSLNRGAWDLVTILLSYNFFYGWRTSIVRRLQIFSEISPALPYPKQTSNLTMVKLLWLTKIHCLKGGCDWSVNGNCFYGVYLRPQCSLTLTHPFFSSINEICSKHKQTILTPVTLNIRLISSW